MQIPCCVGCLRRYITEYTQAPSDSAMKQLTNNFTSIMKSQNLAGKNGAMSFEKEERVHFTEEIFRSQV